MAKVTSSQEDRSIETRTELLDLIQGITCKECKGTGNGYSHPVFRDTKLDCSTCEGSGFAPEQNVTIHIIQGEVD